MGVPKIMIFFAVIISAALYWATSNVCRYNFALEKKTNTLLLNSTEDQNDLGKYEIKKLTRKDLVLMKDSTLIYFEKTK